MRLPQAIHMGYSKAMSTTLKSWLGTHSGIHLKTKTNFFPLYYDNFRKGKEYYGQFFSDAKPEQLCIESDEHLAVQYLDRDWWVNFSNLESIEKISKRIRDILLDPKIIVVIRNQTDMVVSKYIQYIRGGGFESFDSFFHRMFSETDGILRYEGYYYSQVLELLWDYFGRKNVYVIVQEYFRKRPEVILRELANFLDIEAFKKKNVLSNRRSNTSPSYNVVLLERNINKLVVRRKNTHISKANCRFIPQKLYAVNRLILETIDGKIIKDKKKALFLDNEKRAYIRDIFLKDNQRLCLLLNSSAIKSLYL
jgi:hypothetical protein